MGDYYNMSKQETAPFLKKVMPISDQACFNTSVLLLIIFTYLYNENSPRLHYFITLAYPLLIGARVWQYRKLKWQFYTIDFCYFIIAALLIYLNFMPHNEIVFKSVFLWANGIPVVSIALFGNKVIFHELDSHVSLSIHLIPMLVTMRIRWFLIPS